MLIEFLFELKNSIDRHGIRWGVIFAIYAIFRKERRNYRLDKRDREHNSYFRAILENQQILMKRLEVEPCADTQTLINEISAEKQDKGYMSSWLEKLLAQFAARKEIWSYTIWNIGRKKLMEKLKSRKLWMALLAAVLPIINTEFSLGLDTSSIIAVIGAIATYILGQAHVDGKIAGNGGTANEPTQPTVTIGDTK